MEDAVDALKMAFSIFIFTVSLAIVFNMFTLAKETSDLVMERSDNTYFSEYVFASEEINNGREVGIETMIPTLYRYYIEKSKIDIKDSSNKILEVLDEETERLVYNGTEEYRTEEYRKLYPDRISWLANPSIDTQKRVSSYIEGKANEVNSTTLNKYNDENLKKYKNRTFIETCEQKNNGDKKYEGADGSTIYLVKGTTKLHITYTLQE